MSLQWWQYEGLWKVFLQKLWPCCTGCGLRSVVFEPVVVCTDAIVLFPSSHRTSQIFSPWTKRTSRTTHLTFTAVGLCDLETVRVHIAVGFCRCLPRQPNLHVDDSDTTAYGAFLNDFVSRSTQLTITETDEEAQATIRFPNWGGFCALSARSCRRFGRCVWTCVDFFLRCCRRYDSLMSSSKCQQQRLRNVPLGCNTG